VIVDLENATVLPGLKDGDVVQYHLTDYSDLSKCRSGYATYNSPGRKPMSTHTLKEEDLRQFTGTEHWYRHGLLPHITFTDGAKHVADAGGAYWLIDEIATAQLIKEVKGEEFQHWVLKVKDSCATLTCDDGNGNIVYQKEISFTDFPLEKVEFFFCNDVIHLPSEY
jgi:hypothetical protein